MQIDFFFDEKCIINIYFLGRDSSLLEQKLQTTSEEIHLLNKTSSLLYQGNRIGFRTGRFLLNFYPVSIYIDKT